MDIHELVKRAKKQDTEAFADLYELVYKDLYKVAFYTLDSREDAEDVVSETVLIAYEKLNTLRENNKFHAWIFTILSNQCKQKLRKYKDKTFPLEEEIPQKDKDYAGAYDLKIAFGKLSKQEKLIVSLTVFAGYNSGEVGKMLKINRNTIRSKFSRALEKMGKYIK